jgi:hypothetical protein
MSAIKDGRFPIMLDKERHLLFSLNAIDEIKHTRRLSILSKIFAAGTGSKSWYGVQAKTTA